MSNADLHYNLIGFVNDPISSQVISSVIDEIGIAYTEVKQGSIKDIVEFMKKNRSPRILIADISESELPISDIAKIKEYGTPNLNIVVIGDKNEVGIFRDLVHMGVCDYLVKPINNVILKKAISDATTGKKTFIAKTGKMIQVISSVGGAGATTLASNVAWIIANHHYKRAAVVDLDFLYGTANLMLDIKSENSYLDILESPDKIDDYFVETILRKHSRRLYYIGGLCDLSRGVVADPKAFDALIGAIKTQFNYVLVDSQRDVSPLHKVVISRTDIFVIMIEMSLASAQNTARLLEFINSEQQIEKKTLIVANKVGLSSTGALPKESFEKIINRKIDYIMPLDEQSALAAANIGQPLTAEESTLSYRLRDITDDLLGKNEDEIIGITEEEKKDAITGDYLFNKVMDLYNKFVGK